MTDATNALETESAVYKTLLESTKAIPWKIDWGTMKFSYIGPQIESLLGWAPASWASVDDWVERMHPDDRESVVNFCVSQSQSGIDHEADYRALTKDGGYVWIRDVVHVVRKEDGEVESLIGFMFDISQRKQTEEHLLSLQKELEELSYKDGLTGIANRRMFDSMLEKEWANARRTQKPISLILFDIDHFKEYNDHYGHLQGDECLRHVGQILSRANTRPRDLVARFGGEEFVLVLPETSQKDARKVAERCRSLILQQAIPHEKSNHEQMLTVSLGVGTVIPAGESQPEEFINAVDKLLYRAKQKGRNCVEYSFEELIV